MFNISSKEFEKLALNLNRLMRNINSDDVVSIINDDGEPLAEKLKNIVIDKVQDRISNKITEVPDDTEFSAVYQQPKLKPGFLSRFRFKKLAFNIFPSEIRPIIETLGIGRNEQRLLSKPAKHFIHKQLGSAMGEEEGLLEEQNKPLRFL